MRRLISLAVAVAFMAVGPAAVRAEELSREAPGVAESWQGSVLPEGLPLTEAEMAALEGEGLLGAFIGAATGWVTGFASYVTDYWWGRWLGGSPRPWSWRSAWKQTLQGAISGAVAGALTGP